jgi:hypothetical protein
MMKLTPRRILIFPSLKPSLGSIDQDPMAGANLARPGLLGLKLKHLGELASRKSQADLIWQHLGYPPERFAFVC